MNCCCQACFGEGSLVMVRSISSEKQPLNKQPLNKPLNEALSTSVNLLPGEKQETQKIQEQKPKAEEARKKHKKA